MSALYGERDGPNWKRLFAYCRRSGGNSDRRRATSTGSPVAKLLTREAHPCHVRARLAGHSVSNGKGHSPLGPESFGDASPHLRYGENSGDSMHAEPHLRTPCHYQIFF